jgi:hypothetical protein
MGGFDRHPGMSLGRTKWDSDCSHRSQYGTVGFWVRNRIEIPKSRCYRYHWVLLHTLQSLHYFHWEQPEGETYAAHPMSDSDCTHTIPYDTHGS